ncbi:MAG: MFS transporter, partial [Pseudomonadota bacterium]
AIGGAIVAVAGAAGAFVTNALSYIGLIIVLLRWHPVSKPATFRRERIDIAIGAGLRYVAMSPRIRVVMLRGALFGAAAAAIPALLPLVVRDLMGGGAFSYGALFGAFGLGAVGGALSSAELRARFSAEGIVRIGSAAMVVGALGTGLSTTMIISVPCLMLAGAGWVLALSTFNVAVQMSTPRWVVARALSLYQMATFGGMAAGAWGFGVLAEAHTITFALLAAAALQAVGGLLGFLMPVPRVEDVDLDPLGRWQEPETALEILPRSGPIVITVEHRVADAKTEAFLDAMNERRRIRLRDGARRWTLLRDLQDPDLWIERYHVPTWADYVRNAQRPTQADADNFERVRALHIDGAPAIVHRMIERPTATPSRAGSGPRDPL